MKKSCALAARVPLLIIVFAPLITFVRAFPLSICPQFALSSPRQGGAIAPLV